MHHENKPQREYIVANCDETNSIARKLAVIAKCGDLITLTGEVGVGKTTFARAFIRSLIFDKDEIVSPTFTLLQQYESSNLPIYHFDFYRIKESTEILELGFEEAIASGVVLVEWPCRLKEFLPKVRLDIKINQGTETDARSIQFFGRESWSQRLNQFYQ